ncbi:MAG: 23S rRNA (guanosine(2251)-2'-O)-methyltransferase RlmB [Terriglobia bacterium]
MKPTNDHPSTEETLYGIHTVKEALGARPIDYVLVAEGHHSPRVEEIIQLCRARGVSLRFVPRQALDRITGSAHHQNVAAACAARGYEDLDAVASASDRLLLIALDEVEDPANLGAVIRTAVAAGAHGAIIPERRAAGLSGAVARAASGALEHLKVARVTNLARALGELKRKQIWVYGFEARAEKSYLDLDYSAPCVLVLGGEGRGLRRLVRETCDSLAAIPLAGPVESLNVSVAAAIVLYEAARQRRGLNA